jgi:hypothetical protein
MSLFDVLDQAQHSSRSAVPTILVIDLRPRLYGNCVRAERPCQGQAMNTPDLKGQSRDRAVGLRAVNFKAPRYVDSTFDTEQSLPKGRVASVRPMSA